MSSIASDEHSASCAGIVNDGEDPSTIHLPVEATDVPGEEFVDDYEMLDSVDDAFTLSEKMVHYVGGHIMPEHWVACKATLVFHAGSTTSKLATMTKTSREKATLEAYNSAVAALDSLVFKSNAIAFFRHSFREKDKPMTGDALYRYFLDSRNAMRSLILPLFPTDFNKLKSGRGFHESVNAAFIKMYRKELTSRTKDRMTIEQADQELPPMYWEYKKKPWYFGLATIMYRRDPQLAPNVNAVAEDANNLPVSRAALKRKLQYKSHGKTMNSNSIPDVVVVDVDAVSEQKQKTK